MLKKKSFHNLSAGFYKRIPLILVCTILLANTLPVQANTPITTGRQNLAAPELPVLISPDGEAGTNPSYTWYAVAGATSYRVIVGDEVSPPVIYATYTAEEVGCATGEPECVLSPDVTLTPDQTYTWNVTAINGEGDSETAYKSFLTIPAPEIVTLLSPIDEAFIETFSPTYQWQQAQYATDYNLIVNAPGDEEVINLWFTEAEANCTDNVCQVAPAVVLAEAEHHWWVQAQGVGGTSPLGDGEIFTTLQQPPGPIPNLIDPHTAAAANTIFSWAAVSTASRYFMAIIDDADGIVKYSETLEAEVLNCASGEDICAKEIDTGLPSGIYSWAVQPKNDSPIDIGYGVGNGPMSDSMSFEIVPAPTKPVLLSPAGEIFSTDPDFTWEEMQYVDEYFFSVRSGAEVIFEETYDLDEVGIGISCASDICTLSAPVTLESGNYTWYLQASGLGGLSEAGDPVDFTVIEYAIFPVAVSSEGELADGHAYGHSSSESGNIIAFYSYASNLVPGCGDPTENKDHDHPESYKTDVFVHDRVTGFTTCISRNDDDEVGNASSMDPVVSNNGRYVVFASDATNFWWSGASWDYDFNEKRDLFVYDLMMSTIQIVSLGDGSRPTDDDSLIGKITPDGNYVAFTSNATNLTSTTDANGVSDVFLRDLENDTTKLISTNGDLTQSANAASKGFDISDDGETVTFQSWASDMVSGSDGNTGSDVFQWINGSEYPPVPISAPSIGEEDTANKSSFGGFATSDNGFIGFYSFATDIVPGCGDETENIPDAFVYEAGLSIYCITKDTGNASGADQDHSLPVSLSGRYVSFESDNSGIVDGDTNNMIDVFRYDRAAMEFKIISNTRALEAANGDSYAPTISANGMHVIFASKATNLIDGALYEGIYVTDLVGFGNYAPPSDLQASDITENEVTLSWSESDDSDIIDGYHIYQDDVLIETVNNLTTQATIVDLTGSTTYTFKVTAFYVSKESAGVSIDVQTTVSSNPAIIYDDIDNSLSYSGGWTAFSGVEEYYDETYHQTTAQGSTVSLQFYGTKVNVQYASAPGQGKFKVYIDGEYKDTIDQDSSNTEIGWKWFSGYIDDDEDPNNDLLPANHEIQLVYDSSGRIGIIDAIEVETETESDFNLRNWYDDASDSLDYVGSWFFRPPPVISAYDRTNAETTIANAKVSFAFYGLRAALVYPKFPNGAEVDIYLDGEYYNTINQYSSYIRQGFRFTVVAPESAGHVIEFRMKPGQADGKRVYIDAFLVSDQDRRQPGVYDDQDLGFYFMGQWISKMGNPGDDYFMGIRQQSAEQGSMVKMQFTGNNVCIIYPGRPNNGESTIKIDAIPTATISEWYPSIRYGMVWCTGELPLKYDGTHNHSFSAFYPNTQGLNEVVLLFVDGIIIKEKVIRTSTGLYDDRDAALTYSGYWSFTDAEVEGGAHDQTIYETTSTDANLRFYYYGGKIGLVYPSGPNGGLVKVYIDDNPTPYATINQYSSSIQQGNVWTAPASLSAGEHVVEFRLATGQSQGKTMYIDAVQISP